MRIDTIAHVKLGRSCAVRAPEIIRDSSIVFRGDAKCLKREKPIVLMEISARRMWIIPSVPCFVWLKL